MWQKGQSGNPAGPRRDKIITRQLIDELTKHTDPRKKDSPTKLREVAKKLIELALEGNMQAIHEVIDRVEGKPAQESTLTIDDKREAQDWARGELVALLNDSRASREGTPAPNGRAGEPDQLH